MSRSVRRRSSSQRASARSASSSTASSRGATRLGFAPNVTSSASPSECAGSVDTTSTRAPRSAAFSAYDAAHVVLPTPPLPPKKRKLLAALVVAAKGGLDAGELPVERRERLAAAAPLLQLANARQHLALGLREFLFGDLAQLEPHLRRQQLLAQPLGVVHLLVDGGRDLPQHPLDPADQHAVEDEHATTRAPA